MLPTYFWFGLLDQLRRRHGQHLDLLGLGPQQSPFAIDMQGPGLRLRRYGAGRAGGPALLIVPAPIKKPYIWDLAPERSVVRSALAHQFGVYLAEWTEPDILGCAPGLQDYAGTMLADCIAFIREQTGADQVVLAGHSLGGIFAALHSAYRPADIAALVLVDAPLDFAGAPAAQHLLQRPAPANDEPGGHLPGSLLGAGAVRAAPAAFRSSRYADRLASLASREHTLTHWRVERWTLDEQAMSRRLFDDLGELYLHNRFMRGDLAINGARLHPRDVQAPLFSVCQPGGFIAASAVTGFHMAAGSVDKALASYPGDIGVALQHVGPLVGDYAHRQLWPRVFAWLQEILRRPPQPPA